MRNPTRTMKITYILVALLLVPSLATPTTAQERSRKNGIRTQTYVTEGREIGSSALECHLHAAP
jgi:hypothetical protein